MADDGFLLPKSSGTALFVRQSEGQTPSVIDICSRQIGVRFPGPNIVYNEIEHLREYLGARRVTDAGDMLIGTVVVLEVISNS